MTGDKWQKIYNFASKHRTPVVFWPENDQAHPVVIVDLETFETLTDKSEAVLPKGMESRVVSEPEKEAEIDKLQASLKQSIGSTGADEIDLFDAEAADFPLPVVPLEYSDPRRAELTGPIEAFEPFLERRAQFKGVTVSRRPVPKADLGEASFSLGAF